MKKKVLMAILVVAIVGVSCLSFAACSSEQIRIGYQSGTTGQTYVEGLPGFNNEQNRPGYTNATLAVNDLMSGRIDYVITDIAPAKAIASRFSDLVKVIDINLTVEEYCFAVNPNDSKGVLTQLNTFMKNFKTELAELQIKYIEGTNEKKIIKSAQNPTNPLTVATSPDFPPFENISTNGDGYEGYDLEVMAMFCERYGYDLVINEVNFDAIVQNVGSGMSDVGAAALTWSEDRAEVVTFTSSYYDATQVIICLKGDTTFDNCKTREDVEAILKKFNVK